MDNSKIFTGVVITSNAGSRAVTIKPDSYNQGNGQGHMGQMMQGLWVSSLLSNFIGFDDCSLPQPGTKVLCVATEASYCYVLGNIPSPSIGTEVFPARTMLGAKNALADEANRIGHQNNTTILQDNRQPSDIVDGEHVVANEYGVLLGLYQQLANLKASELAQVQCFLLDDLVRIISHNFQHYTALGEYNIYHDGKKLMAEFGATHKPAESYGRPAVEDDGNTPMFSKGGTHTVDDKQDFFDIEEDERVKAIERFKWFLGSVGDFLHVFLCRPDPKEVRVLDPDGSVSKPDTGLADLHIGTDGGIHIRSVKEVFIEKTNWIRVPLRKAAPDDPNGDDGKELEYDKKEKFEFKDEFKYKENPFTYALQIRDYVAYVNEKTGYQNFKKHEKDFYVNDKIDEENSLKEIKQIDDKTDLNQEDYQLRTAGIYLMPNGGITIRDAWNSAIVMEGGNIYIQPAKDLVSQPLRNNIVKAGGHINMACKKNIDLSSSEEGLRLKSEKAQYFYSDKGGFVIEANGKEDTPGTPDPTKEAIENVGGIVLKSKLSIYNYAEKNVVNYAKKNLLFQAMENADLVAVETLTLFGQGAMYSFSDGSIIEYSGASSIIMSDGSAIFAGIGSTAFGQKDQTLGFQYAKLNPFVDTLYGAVPVSDFTDGFEKAKEAKYKLLEQTVFKEEAKFEDLKFKFLKSNKYGSLNPQEDAIPTTLAQQDDLLTSLYELANWEEKEINETLPYPGKDLFENFYLSAEKPVNLEENKLGKDYSNKADSETKPAEITLESLQKYKIQK